MSIKDAKRILDSYKEDPTLTTFHILHLYPKNLTCGKGIRNYRFFEVIGYNRDLKLKKNLGRHDEILTDQYEIHQIAIYADGSTLLYLKCAPVRIINHDVQTLFL